MNPLDLVRAEFPATVLKRQIVADEPRRLERWIARQAEGLRVVLLVVDEQAHADNRLFRRYRGYVVKPFSAWSGYTPAEAHEELLALHATFEHRLPNGKVVTVRWRTHLMPDDIFREYIRRCEDWLISEGCVLPARKQERVAS